MRRAGEGIKGSGKQQKKSLSFPAGPVKDFVHHVIDGTTILKMGDEISSLKRR